MDIQKVRQLLRMEEGEKLDFKAQLHLTTESDKKELVKDVSAIANTRGGRGHIVFGVEDKTKRILGIDPGAFKEEQIQQIIYNRSDPPVPVGVDFVRLEDKTLGVISIYRSVHAPHQIIQTGAFYIRRGSTTDFARRSELASMMQENGLMTYETVGLKNAGLEDLDSEKMKDYFSSMSISLEQHPNEVLLSAFGFISEKGGNGYCPTIGGMLLFGRHPQVYLPQSHILITWNEEVRLITGGILDMLDTGAQAIREILNEPDYPFHAVEEALANALAHRDYTDLSRGINVIVSDKAVEIINPGAITQGSRVYLSLRDFAPIRRNAWLYQRLITIDSKKRFLKSGLGMSRIKSAFEGTVKVKFINLGKQNTFKVVLPRAPQQNVKKEDV